MSEPESPDPQLQQYPPHQYQPQQYPPQHYQPPYVVAARPPYDGLAITSFILGVLWLSWLGSIVAVILGHIALRNIRRTHASGRGLAIAGLILGYIGLSTLALFILFAIIGAVSGSGSGS